MRKATRKTLNRFMAGIQTPAEARIAARTIRADWQEFLDRSDFEFAQDALSKELVSLEDAGYEEKDTRAIFGFEPDAVSSGVWGTMDHFYEEEACEFTVG